MSIKQRIWLLPIIAIIASILSLSANYWFSTAARTVLSDAETLQYPTVNLLNSLISVVDEVEDTLRYAVSVDDKNAISAVDGKAKAFADIAGDLAKIKGQRLLSEQLLQEFDAYHHASSEALLLMLHQRPGDTTAAIIEMQATQATLKAALQGAHAKAVASLESNLAGARLGLVRQLIASFACALAVICGLSIVSYFLIPTIERDAVLLGVSDYTDNAVMTADVQGRITWVNAGFQRMSALDASQTLGRTPEELLQRQQLDPQACDRMRAARAARKGWSEDVRSRTSAGNEYVAHIEAQVVLEKNGSIKGYILIETDVTQRHLDAEALRLARDAANAASRAKSEFLANMSHEIRTPLNGVIGMTGLLLDSDLDTEQRELAEIARSSGESLLALINDVLDYSKIEAGRLELESADFDMISVIESAIDAVSLQAVKKQVELFVDFAGDMQRHLRGDSMRVRQVLVNILGNAVKFTEKGEVRVTVSSQHQAARCRVQIEVRDSGIGMTPGQVARLFTPFTQADGSTTRRFGGTGLGLSITKSLVDAMDGELRVNSTPEVGSTFNIALSFERAAQPSVAPRANLSGVHVLVVEDHAINRRILGSQLASADARATMTVDAQDAIRQWRLLAERNDLPQLILLDHDLPDHDGVWVADQLRAIAPGSVPPIILLSSLGGLVRGRGETSSFARVLTKPLKHDLLIDAAKDILRGSSTSRPVARPSPEPASQGVRILVAEDNVVNQKVIVRLLQKLGASVVVADNGSEALNCLRSARYDLILMDCQMPILDGYQTTAQIRRGEAGSECQHLPIIALTANALEGDRERCLAAGMTDFMTKPIDPGTLRHMIDTYSAQNGAGLTLKHARQSS